MDDDDKKLFALIGCLSGFFFGFFGGVYAGHSDMECQRKFSIEHKVCAEVADTDRCHDDAVRNLAVCEWGG